jgi:uncharacterized protein (TIGR03085 family)
MLGDVTSFSRSERARLCDTALSVGATAPTLCGDWDVKDLLAHLVVRDGDPLGAPGIVLKPLAGFTERASRRLGKESLDSLVRRVRRPPLWSPYRIGVLDTALNTLEFYVHHEDIRRAAARWDQRRLTPGEQAAIWRGTGVAGRGLVRPAGVPVQIRWAGTDRTTTLASGSDPVTITGLPGEVVLFLFGRQRTVGLEFDGPPESVAELRGAGLGI